MTNELGCKDANLNRLHIKVTLELPIAELFPLSMSWSKRKLQKRSIIRKWHKVAQN